MPSDPRVRAAMDTLARTLKSHSDVPLALSVLTQGAVDAIPGAGYASISVHHPEGKLETLAATDPVIEELDAHQHTLQEGPCYEAATREQFVVSFDIARDSRWPNFGSIAGRAGIHGQLSVLLTTGDRDERSTLNVYAPQPHEFDEESVEVAEIFGSHASVALGLVHTVESLGDAIGSRQAIGQAVGIVMERYQIDEERAFDFLVRTSRQSNVKLRDIAADIVTGLNRRTSPSVNAEA